jgi:hypothetical protein
MTVYYIQKITALGEEKTNVLRVGDDNVVWTLGEGEQDSGYLAWLAEGNTAEPWEPEETE